MSSPLRVVANAAISSRVAGISKVAAVSCSLISTTCRRIRSTGRSAAPASAQACEQYRGRRTDDQYIPRVVLSGVGDVGTHTYDGDHRAGGRTHRGSQKPCPLLQDLLGDEQWAGPGRGDLFRGQQRPVPTGRRSR